MMAWKTEPTPTEKNKRKKNYSDIEDKKYFIPPCSLHENTGQFKLLESN